MDRREYLELIAKAKETSSVRANKAEKMLVALEKELENRDISTVPTEALLQSRALFSAIELVEKAWQSSCLTSIYFETEEEHEDRRKKQDSPQNRSYEKLGVDPIGLLFAQDLLPLFDTKRGGTFCEELGQFRNKMIDEIGYVFPDVRVMDSINLGVNEYEFYIHSHKVASGRVYLDRVIILPELFEQYQVEIPKDVIIDEHSVYDGAEVHWFLASSVPRELKLQAESPTTVICRHLKNVLIQHADIVVSHFDAAKLLELVRQQNASLVQELMPALIPITTIREVIAGLLCERVSIKDILFVFECITKHAHDYKDSKSLLERVRCSLAKTIIAGIVLNSDSKSLDAIALPSEVEKRLMDNNCSPEERKELHGRICDELMKAHRSPQRQVIICTSEVRLTVFRLIVPTVSDIAVLTQAEIPSDIKVTLLN